MPRVSLAVALLSLAARDAGRLFARAAGDGAQDMTCAGGHVTVATPNGDVLAEVIGSAEVLHGGTVLVAALNSGGDLGGRSYFGTACDETRPYTNSDFLELPLAGQSLSWEVVSARPTLVAHDVAGVQPMTGSTWSLIVART
jgi:hypothetical protein